MEPDDPAYKGQSEYTPFFLMIYDPVILGFFTRVVWRCPTTLLVERYRRLLSLIIVAMVFVTGGRLTGPAIYRLTQEDDLWNGQSATAVHRHEALRDDS